MILFNQDNFLQFKEKKDKDFYLMVPLDFKKNIQLQPSKTYAFSQLISCDNNDEFYSILDNICPEAHIFYVSNPSQGHVNSTKKKPQQVVIQMVTSGFPKNHQSVKQSLLLSEKTDINAQIKSADYFFDLIENNSSVVFKNNKYHTSAKLKLDNRCQFNELYGYANDKGVHVTPLGEIAITNEKAFKVVPKPLSFDGTILLDSYPLIVVLGPEPFFLASTQSYLFNCLSSLINNPVIATLKKGKITQLVPAKKKSDLTGLRVLSALIETDERYATLAEIGIGLNTQFQLKNTNFAYIEVYGHYNYCVHYGFGNTNTGFHIDFITPSTKIIIGDTIINDKKS